MSLSSTTAVRSFCVARKRPWRLTARMRCSGSRSAIARGVLETLDASAAIRKTVSAPRSWPDASPRTRSAPPAGPCPYRSGDPRSGEDSEEGGIVPSGNRILTTHVGALQRTPDAEAALVGEAPEEALRPAVDDVVRRQAEAGIDIVDDGEYGKSIWQWYVTERLGGIEREEHTRPPLRGRDHERFAEFYAYAQETPDVLFHGSDRAFWASIATRPKCVGPITYTRGPVERDIANLQA